MHDHEMLYTVYSKRNAHLIPNYFYLTLGQGQKTRGPWKYG